MGRLNEVRKEIEWLCKEIGRDALNSRHHPATGDKVTPAPPIHIHLVVPGSLARMRIKISLQKGDNHKRR
jgi:hypothetical protein